MLFLRYALIALTVLVTLQLGAAGRELAPQRLDVQIGGVDSAGTISNGTTVLWLWGIESFRAGKHVYAAITETSGAVRVPAQPVLPYIDQYGIGATVAPGGYFLYRGDASGIQQRKLTDDGVLGPPSRVATKPNDLTFAAPPPGVLQMPAVQEGPRIVSNGSGFLAVWAERGGTSQTIVARPLDREGIPLGSPAEVTRIAGSFGDHAVAFGGMQYLVIWQNGSQIFGARLAASGLLIDQKPFVIATINGASHFGIASDGNDFLVTWADGPRVYGTIVRSDATVAAAQALNPAENQIQVREPVVAYDGARYIAAYVAEDMPYDFCFGCVRESRVEAVRISAQGLPLDLRPTLVADDADASHMGIASSGHDVLLTFVSHFLNVTAVTLHTESTLSAESPMNLFRWFDIISPSVTWSGDSYVVAFRYTSAGFDFDGSGEWYLGSMRVGSDGSHGPLTATITGAPRELEVEPPGVSHASVGGLVIAVSEARAKGEMPRAVDYSPADLQPVTAPLPPSIAWQLSADGRNLIVTWPRVWNDERGFFLSLYTKGGGSFLRLPQGATSASIPWPANLIAIDLRVWSEGGFASTKVAVAFPRTRATRH